MHCAVIVQIKEHVRKNEKLFSKISLLKMFVFVPVVTWCISLPNSLLLLTQIKKKQQ